VCHLVSSSGNPLTDTPDMNSTVIFRKSGLSKADAFRRSEPATGARRQPQPETLMIVDDHHVILRCMKMTAEKISNAKVETYSCPLQALRAYRENPDRYRAVITDYHMPEMTGVELIDLIHSIRPDQPIVLMSAAASPEETDLKNNPRCRFLRKPFGWHELTREIDDLETDRFANRI
jgi:DNA-binding NtrC family response regulator